MGREGERGKWKGERGYVGSYFEGAKGKFWFLHPCFFPNEFLECLNGFFE
jgi:hypothetical protein